jgi:hypothetical protein
MCPISGSEKNNFLAAALEHLVFRDFHLSQTFTCRFGPQNAGCARAKSSRAMAMGEQAESFDVSPAQPPAKPHPSPVTPNARPTLITFTCQDFSRKSALK